MLRIFQDTSKGTFLVLVTVLLLDGIAEQLSILAHNSRHLLGSCALLVPVAVTLIFAYRLIFRSGDETYVTRVALAIVLLSLVLRLIWIFAVDSYQVNDFGEYLNNATDKTDTLWRRTAFYTYPLILIFGKSLLALKITNVLLATATTWFFFLAGRIVVGIRAAALALPFFMWNPNLWYSMTLASHDIPGLFWLAVFFYLSVLLQRRLWAGSKSWLCNLGISLFIGVSIFFVGAVRSYEHGAIISLAACAVVQSARVIFPGISRQNLSPGMPGGPAPQRPAIVHRLKYAIFHLILLFLIPVTVYRVADVQVWKAFHAESNDVWPGLACYLTATNVLGTSEYEEITNWYEQQCPLIKKNEQSEFAFRKLMHEITYSPSEYLLHVERKNRVLSRADAYLGWSTGTEFETWDATHDQVKRINRFNYNAQQGAVALANALLFLLVFWRVLLCASRPFRPAAIVPAVFSVTYYGMFLFLLENQARYSIFLIFIFSWMAAEALEHLHQKGCGNSLLPVSPPAFKRLYGMGLLILAAATAAFMLASSLIAESSLTLRDQQGFTEARPGDILGQTNGAAEVTPVFVTNNFKQLIVSYPLGGGIPPGSTMAVQRTFTVTERPHHHLRFFLSTDTVRDGIFQDTINCEDANIEYYIAVNRRLIASGRLNDISGNKYFSFDSAHDSIFSSRMTLQLVLRNLSGIPSIDSNRGPVLALEYVDLQ